jgi:hypothetical protein
VIDAPFNLQQTSNSDVASYASTDYTLAMAGSAS